MYELHTFESGTNDYGAMLAYKAHEVLNAGREGIMVSLDVKGAFDRVWWSRLKKKLKVRGMTGKAFKLMKSYFYHRNIKVVAGGVSSSLKAIYSGVPQGAKWSTLLWDFDIAELDSATLGLQGELYCYADDTTLWYEITRENRLSIIDTINADLQLIWDWGIDNKTTFEASKTHSLLVSNKRSLKFDISNICFGGSRVDQVSELKIVGFLFQSGMTWGSMVSKLAKKGRQRMAAFFRMKHSLSSQNLEIMYKAFVRSVMEYGHVSFRGAAVSHLNKLDVIQDRCSKIGGFELESLASRRDASLIGLVLKLLDGDGRGEVACCTPKPLTTGKNGLWIETVPKISHKRKAAAASELKTKEILKSCRAVGGALAGYQLENKCSADSKSLYVRSANGSASLVWSKLPQELIFEGFNAGWKSVRKNCQRFLTGKKMKVESKDN